MKPREYTVYYPSGKTFNLTGVFSLLSSADPEVGTEPAITVWDEVTVLDPRALVTCAGGIIYNPRNNASIAEPMRKWLAEHPEWPPKMV